MINSRKELQIYLDADLQAAGLKKWRFWYRLKYPVLHWQRNLRKLEYLTNTKKSFAILRPYVKLRGILFLHQSIWLGFSIPVNVFGPGLSIAHWGTIVVNHMCRVGSNCRIHPGTTLGEKDGAAPTVGDNCYLGPGSKVFGGVTLGSDVKIGSNAVVNKSFPDGSILVGIPAYDIRNSSSRHSGLHQ